ncbi:hypothetical protein OIV83_006397 [Microbotryomycetes sp. JL201]|nr:hypothetical protein OIV83_006397 [Microbotryomycetes sp. JL201]
MPARSGPSVLDSAVRQLIGTAAPIVVGRETSWHAQLDDDRAVQHAFVLVEDASTHAQGHKIRLIERLSARVGLNARHVRLCWPASQPTDYVVRIVFDGDQAYVVVTAVATSVLFPERPPFDTINFTLLVEPAYFGGVPASTLPIIGFIALVVAALVGVRAPQQTVTCLHSIITTADLPGRQSHKVD